MVKKFVYGTPFETEAVVKEIPSSEGNPDYGTFSTENGFSFTTKLADDDMVFGLGEANRGINKRGFVYVSDNVDDGLHTENKQRMYAAHNFIVISGQQNLGLFFDYPAQIRFDIGFTRRDWLEVTCTLKHVGGHSESVSMGGPPDAGGAKNALQARASTKSYLERYTLKAICGVAEGGDDTDGNPPPASVPLELLDAAREAAMGGWAALSKHIKGLSAADRAALEPESYAQIGRAHV